jgi:hypothetical protein
MANSVPEKIVSSVSIDLAGKEARIEKLLAGETGSAEQATLRISGGQKGKNASGPLTLSEEQLIEGVISNSFIGKLREKIEI